MGRLLLLNGFTATGKTAVGQLVARRAQAPFVDLKAHIEQSAGEDGATLVGQEPDSARPALERQELDRILRSGQAGVVALGSETLMARHARLRALDEAVVVALEASPAELIRRAKAGEGGPLSCGADAAEHVAELLERRQEAYAEAHARIDTDGVDPGQVADRVFAVWQRDALAVAAGSRSYAVETGYEFAPSRMAEVVRGASQALLVTDRNVWELHGEKIQRAVEATGVGLTTVVLEPGEEHKNIASLEGIWKAALQAGIDRSSVVIGLGGGVVTDVAGFAAATWARGVRWAALPTTLLAMVDASVGGKTAIDLLTAKNAVGAFWQPSSVLCDVDFLRTEPARGYLSALAEVVKTALIGDPQLMMLLEARAADVAKRDPDLVAELVRRSVRVKASVVSRDEREGGLRACLNLGHTVGHALESHGGYTELSHGEAVSLGLVVALRVGERLGTTPAALTQRTTALLETLGLPTRVDGRRLAEASRLIGHDKKRSGSQLRFVVAREVGQVDTVRLGLDQLGAHVLALR